MTSDSYPNLMRFGADIPNCPLMEKCPDYRACIERFREDLFGPSGDKEETET